MIGCLYKFYINHFINNISYLIMNHINKLLVIYLTGSSFFKYSR